MAKYSLIINEVADQNLFDLYCEGVIRWGLDQATAYYDAFYGHFDSLCNNPFLYQAV